MSVKAQQSKDFPFLLDSTAAALLEGASDYIELDKTESIRERSEKWKV